MKRIKLKLLVLILLLITTPLIYFFFILKPSNQRNWVEGMDVLAQVNINNNQVTIKNIKDYRFARGQIPSPNYQDRIVNVKDIERVWFVFEPFIVKPFTNFKGVAHTYFVFDFKNAEPIAVSVEARREKGEKYDAFKGLLNQFELIYIWGTEGDLTVRRVVMENNPLYMFPLKISQNGVEKLFLQLAETTHQLESQPRFYNTITSNCTNELAKAANSIKKDAIPRFNRALVFTGYSVEELYKLGFLPTDTSLEELKQKYYISDIVKEIYMEPDFSSQLRLRLQEK